MTGLIPYIGGKSLLAGWINSLLPTRPYIYCEPFAGAANVLFRRRPAPIEVINDLDGRLINVYRVMQDRGKARELIRMLRWTPRARDELRRAITLREDAQATDVTLAWAYLVSVIMGFSGRPAVTTGNFSVSRTAILQPITEVAAALRVKFRRLARVTIECRDALRCMEQYDSPDTLHYLDPPYVLSTRVGGKAYAHEMSDEQHMELISVVSRCRGAVAISGYAHAIYDQLGWDRQDSSTVCRSARMFGTREQRVECLWRNPRCVKWAEQDHLPLFAPQSGGGLPPTPPFGPTAWVSQKKRAVLY